MKVFPNLPTLVPAENMYASLRVIDVKYWIGGVLSARLKRYHLITGLRFLLVTRMARKHIASFEFPYQGDKSAKPAIYLYSERNSGV